MENDLENAHVRPWVARLMRQLVEDAHAHSDPDAENAFRRMCDPYDCIYLSLQEQTIQLLDSLHASYRRAHYLPLLQNEYERVMGPLEGITFR